MKKLPLILSTISLVGVIVLAIVTFTCKSGKTVSNVNEPSESVSPTTGAVVYFNLDRVLNEYDMANDLRSVVETKVNSINQEVNRRGNKLDQDIRSFQEKVNKGLMTQTTAQNQSISLQQRQQEFQNYAAQKQQEIIEEQTVMMNQILDAINTYVIEYNAEKQYSMILTTQYQGELALPVVNADPMLDITDEFLEGLNAKYVKSKSSQK